jgi:hypothetical protein
VKLGQPMGRKYEKELLANVRRSRRENKASTDDKTCGNPTCPFNLPINPGEQKIVDLRTRLPIPKEMFYSLNVRDSHGKIVGQRLDSYCIVCRRGKIEQRREQDKLDAEAGDEKALLKRARQLEKQREKRGLAANRRALLKTRGVPCAEHPDKVETECGCDLSPLATPKAEREERARRLEAKRAKLRRAMRGNKNAVGNQGPKGRKWSPERRQHHGLVMTAKWGSRRYQNKVRCRKRTRIADSVHSKKIREKQ